MNTSEPRLVAADIGNATIKYSPEGTAEWSIEPALVRAPAGTGYDIARGGQRHATAARPFVYISGPARIEPAAWLIGEEAARYGDHKKELSIVGAADVRVQSPAYLLLHLYAIAASLPEACSDATILFAGGLPARDMIESATERALKARLKGDHVVMWGERTITIRIDKALILPQQVAAVATQLFTPDGAIVSNGRLNRKRLVLVIGGGTADWTGRVGLDLVSGTEGGINIGLITAAAATVRMVKRQHGARSLTEGRVLDMIRTGEHTIHKSGAELDIAPEITAGLAEAGELIMAQVLTSWQAELDESEVGIAGGGGQKLFKAIYAKLAGAAPTVLYPNPVASVAEGTRRLARYRLRSK